MSRSLTSDWLRDLTEPGWRIQEEQREMLARSIFNATPERPTSAQIITGRERQAEPHTHTRSQLLVLAALLEKTLEVVRNVEAEDGSEGEQLQALIAQSEAAIKTVLLEGHSHG